MAAPGKKLPAQKLQRLEQCYENNALLFVAPIRPHPTRELNIPSAATVSALAKTLSLQRVALDEVFHLTV